MVQSRESLAATVDRMESKASDYETATNFEAKLERYTNELEGIEGTIGRLHRNVERMEFLTAVLVEVIDERERPPNEVEEARRRVERVVDKTEDEYWEMVDSDQVEEYGGRVQQTKSQVQDAINSLEDELDDFEREWKTQLEAARKIQRLLGDGHDVTGIARKIERVVDSGMRDDTESITSLGAEWKGLRKNWEKRGLDWDEFQEEYDLSDRTIDRLQTLAEGKDVDFDRLDETILTELLSVEPAQSVVKITI
jgi:chromosome segregation ATPase